MKQRIVSIIKCCTILLSLAIFMTGCTQDIQIPSVDPSSESESVFKDFTDGLKSIEGTSFSVYAKSEGCQIDGDSGTLATLNVAGNKYLVSIDYDSSLNQIQIISFGVSNSGKVEKINTVFIDEAIEICDSFKLYASYVSLPNGKETIMVESRDEVYSYADGINYKIWLVNISENGQLELFYEDGQSGSGDEDITADIRKTFNSASGNSYTQEQFEDVFYDGNMFSEKEMYNALAKIEYKSDAGKKVDEEDFDKVSEIVEQLNDLETTPGKVLYWGSGEFSSL